MKRTLSSFENSSRVCQNHCTSWCCSSTSLYRTTFFRTSTDISGIPQTICSNCLAVRRDSKGTGTIQDIPSLTAATYWPKTGETFEVPTVWSLPLPGPSKHKTNFSAEKWHRDRISNVCQIHPPTHAAPARAVLFLKILETMTDIFNCNCTLKNTFWSKTELFKKKLAVQIMMAKPSKCVNTKKTLFQLRYMVRTLYLFCKTWDLASLMRKLFSNADNTT